MYFSPALVLAAVPFLVAANPFEEGPRNGIPVPIAKRSGFRSADGVIDIAIREASGRPAAYCRVSVSNVL
jgi:hypothetical protein